MFYMPNRGVARIFVWGGGCSNYDTIILVNKLLHTCRFVHGLSWVCAQFRLGSTTLDEEDWNTTPIHEGMWIQTTRVLLGGNRMSIRVGLKAKRVNFIGSVKILSNLFEKPLHLIKRWQY